MHANISHLLFNMIALYAFGHIIEPIIGKGYIILYLVAAILNTYIYAILNPNSTIMTLGASGAISTIVAIYLLLFKKTSSIVNVLQYEVFGLMFSQYTGINYLSHIIGLVLGGVYYVYSF